MGHARGVRVFDCSVACPGCVVPCNTIPQAPVRCLSFLFCLFLHKPLPRRLRVGRRLNVGRCIFCCSSIPLTWIVQIVANRLAGVQIALPRTRSGWWTTWLA